jgi:hypothetical protein
MPTSSEHASYSRRALLRNVFDDGQLGQLPLQRSPLAAAKLSTPRSSFGEHPHRGDGARAWQAA